jgi:hypothetical protein
MHFNGTFSFRSVTYCRKTMIITYWRVACPCTPYSRPPLVLSILKRTNKSTHLCRKGFLNLTWFWPCIVINTWRIKGQLDATDWFFYCKTYFSLNVFRAPLWPSSGAQELYRWFLPVVLGAVKMENVIYKLGSVNVIWVLCIVCNCVLNCMTQKSCYPPY